MSLTVISYPSIPAPSRFDLKLLRNDGQFVSPLSGQIQDLQRTGAKWQMDMSWNTLAYADSQTLMAWCLQMARAGIRCGISIPAYQQQGGGGGSSPKVNGGGQTGSLLVTKNWTHSVSGILKVGDMITITDASSKHQTLMVTAVANSDSLGDSTLSIEPPLRISPADGASISLTPTLYCKFAKPSASQSFTPPRLSAISISVIEDIEA